MPYLLKEMRSIVSDRTPIFIAVPRTVHIWRQAPCNGRCIMCTLGFLDGEERKALMTSRFTDEMMIRALREIHELCGRGTLVSYMGGEPTTSKHVIEWIELAGKLGLDFRFTTNGYNLNEEMARRFVAAGLFNIGISIESLDPKINETIRPYPNGTKKTLKSIELLLAERQRQNRHLSLNIKTVVTNANLESFPEIARRFGKLEGVICTPQVFEPLPDMPNDIINLLRVQDIPRLRKVVDEIKGLKREGFAVHATDQALDDMVKGASDPQAGNANMHEKNQEMGPEEPPCNIATDNLWISDGEVKLCPYHPALADFAAKDGRSLKELWHGDRAKQVRVGTRACRRLCTVSCLRRTALAHKIKTFIKLA
jgi:sulfatase maturation enzyme AslB (radical SAM superfamily)